MRILQDRKHLQSRILWFITGAAWCMSNSNISSRSNYYKYFLSFYWCFAIHIHRNTKRNKSAIVTIHDDGSNATLVLNKYYNMFIAKLGMFALDKDTLYVINSYYFTIQMHKWKKLWNEMHPVETISQDGWNSQLFCDVLYSR